MNYRDRLQRIEKHVAERYRSPDMMEDALSFWGGIARLAEAYPAEASLTPAADRVAHFTPVQHLAWVQRFRPGSATLCEIWQQHATTIPEWYCDGDERV